MVPHKPVISINSLKLSTHAGITIRSKDFETQRHFVLHCLQRVSQTPFRRTAYYKVLSMGGNEESTHNVNVRGNCTMELCVAQFWSSLGNSQLEIDVDFHGLDYPRNLHLDFPSTLLRVDLRAPFRTENLAINIRYVG